MSSGRGSLDAPCRPPQVADVTFDDGGAGIDLEEVDAFAEAAHEGQTRFSGRPYIEHPRAVRAILEDEFPEPVDDVTLAVALLHDVLEDCDVHPRTLKERYGTEVQEGVTLLSWEIKALDLDRDARVYWSGIRRGPRLVRLVKAADRIHNMRDSIARGDRAMRRRYLEETDRELLPVLREAGESWLVERLEELMGQIRERGD
jgi:(p)ppGpp synthase/HD superfamily hydrolase